MPGHHNLAKLTVKFAVTHTDILHANFELPIYSRFVFLLMDTHQIFRVFYQNASFH